MGGLFGAIGNIIEGQNNRTHQNQVQDKNWRWQTIFAQNGINWRVQDAKRAGIHPLAALGAQTTAGVPTYIGGLGNQGYGEFGKSIGDNIMAYLNRHKIKEQEEANAEILKEKVKQERIQTKLMNRELGPQGNVTPFDPQMDVINGKANPGTVSVPAQITKSNRLGYTAGFPALETGYIDKDAYFTPTISRDLAESFEQDKVEGWRYTWKKFVDFAMSKSFALQKDMRESKAFDMWLQRVRKHIPEKIPDERFTWVYDLYKHRFKAVKRNKLHIITNKYQSRYYKM